MDIPRYLLIAASAALAVMLLGEWTAFKEQQLATTERTRLADTLSMPSDDFVASNPALALTESNTPTSSGDIPLDVPIIEVSTNDEVDKGSQQQLITVKTNTLDIVIDLVGGDIVEAALRDFPDKIDQPDDPFVLLERNDIRTYIAQSGLVGPNGTDVPQRARYTSLSNIYHMEDNQPLQVDLRLTSEDPVKVIKRYRFEPSTNLITLTFAIDNTSNTRWQAVPFVQLKRDSSPPPDADTSGFGMQPFIGAATTTPEERFQKFSFGDMADDPWQGSNQGGWIAMLQHYFLSAWIPADNQNHQYFARQNAAGFNIAGLTSTAIQLDPGQNTQWSAQLYLGPKDQYRLAEISPHLDLTVDYGWLWWIAQPLFWLLTQIQAIVVNWGVAIILLTVLVKGAFFKLSAASYRSMAKMRKVQPKMQSIREQYADDKQKQSQAMMALYKKEKINPMGGCLPILIQMPVFIALYWVLMESVELRQAPFALWIKDLSVMDPYFVLPVLMGASMYFMQKLNPPPPDPMQAKIMQYLPIVFTFFFLWFPAGLVLYWVCNNLLSMAQQWFITRAIDREGLKT